MLMRFPGIISLSSVNSTHRLMLPQPHPAQMAGLPCTVQARLDISSLDRSVEHYFRHCLAESSHRSYNSVKKRYVDFCSDAGFLPVPAAEHQLCQFVSHMADVGLKHKTIKCYLSAVRHKT